MLYYSVNVLLNVFELNILTYESMWNFGASLNWPLEEMQFLEVDLFFLLLGAEKQPPSSSAHCGKTEATGK